MDTAAHVGGSGAGLGEPPEIPRREQPVAGVPTTALPWNGVHGEQPRRSSRGWAKFGPTASGIDGGDWAAEFGGHSTVNGHRGEKAPRLDSMNTLITEDQRLTSAYHPALNGSSTRQSWGQCICARTTSDTVCVHADTCSHGNTCTCTCSTTVTGESGSQTDFRESVVPREVLDDSDWQDFTSCRGGQTTTTSTEAETTSGVLVSSMILGNPLGPRQTVCELDSKPRSSSTPLGQRPRANAMDVLCLCESSRAIFRQSFAVSTHPSTATSHSDSLSDEEFGSLPGVLDQRLWSRLIGSCSPDHLASSYSNIEDRLHGVLFPGQVCSLVESATPEEPSLGLTNGFDWSQQSERAGSVSPDFLPSIFRPKRDSVVDIEFDHTRAAMGLASLSLDELQTMCDEMSSKFQRLSDELISELQQRDVVVSEMDSKNRFISAILKVQNMRHSVRTGVNGSGIDMMLRNRHLSRLTKAREEKQHGKYLQTVVPYKPPEDMQWSVSTLRQLTKILQAIAEDSDSVPSLVSDYLQSEVLVSPVRGEPPVSLEDSLSRLSV